MGGGIFSGILRFLCEVVIIFEVGLVWFEGILVFVVWLLMFLRGIYVFLWIVVGLGWWLRVIVVMME